MILRRYQIAVVDELERLVGGETGSRHAASLRGDRSSRFCDQDQGRRHALNATLTGRPLTRAP
jgi:hypothetical protein